MLKNNK